MHAGDYSLENILSDSSEENALEQMGFQHSFISCHNKEHHNRSTFTFLQGFKKTSTQRVSITWNGSLIVEGTSQCCLKSWLLSDLRIHLQIFLTLIVPPSVYKVINWVPRIIQDNLHILKS